MYEERPDLSRIMRGIEKRIFASRELVAAIERSPLAPPAAGDDLRRLASLLDNFCHEVRAVGDEPAVNTIDTFERPLDLRGRVVARLQAADRSFDYFPQPRDIAGNSFSDAHVHSAILAGKIHVGTAALDCPVER